MLKANVENNHIYMKTHHWGHTDNYGYVQWDDGGGGQVKQILIWHKDLIFGFKTIYEKHNTIFISEMHGIESGNLEIIRPSKPLTWMSGQCSLSRGYSRDNIISSLKFGNDIETYGPFGSATGEPFHYKGKEEIIGFHGCSKGNQNSGHICAIGLYIKIKASLSVDGMRQIKVENAR